MIVSLPGVRPSLRLRAQTTKTDSSAQLPDASCKFGGPQGYLISDQLAIHLRVHIDSVSFDNTLEQLIELRKVLLLIMVLL